MRVFITGAGGQVGRELVDAFVGHDVVAADHATLDVSDRDAVVQAITASAPDAVIHAAAWTAVDACEGDPDRAFRVNALGHPVHRRGRAAGSAPDLCYLSTDYVFDGTKADPYDEWDAPNPTSVYGRSKLGGEEELDPDDTIVRTSWVCGFHGGNMVKTILRLAVGARRALVRRRPAGPPDVRRRPRPHRAQPRRRATPRPVPRHQPGRGVVVRVRPGGALRRGPRPATGSTRSRPPSSTRRGRRPAPRTRCSTTPPCASAASTCSRTTARRSIPLVARLLS